MFDLAGSYRSRGMAAYSELQEHEFQLEASAGYRAVKHQAFVGAGVFRCRDSGHSKRSLVDHCDAGVQPKEEQFETKPAEQLGRRRRRSPRPKHRAAATERIDTERRAKVA